MRIREIGIAGYRSLRAIRFPVGGLTVFVGANGVGKTNLYRALQLLQASAAGTLSRELASEGGMQSALWAGKRRTNQPARMKLSVGLGGADRGRPQAEFSYDAETGVTYSYAIDIGLPMPTAAALPLEPQVKEETLLFHKSRRPVAILDRRGPRAVATDEEGKKQALGTELLASETALGALQDPARFPDVDVVRRTMLDWRFYHDFRSDRASPLRQPCLAVTTHDAGVGRIGPRRRVRDARPCPRGHHRSRSRHRRRLPRRAARRAGAGTDGNIRADDAGISEAGVRSRRTVGRARCATWRWPALCSATGCPHSSRSMSRNPACIPSCSNRWRA